MVTFLRIRAKLRLPDIGNVLVGDDDPALVGLQESHDVPQGHGFADAAPADDGDRLARHRRRSCESTKTG